MSSCTPTGSTSWLTPPSPDTTGDSFPGGTREGWVLFSLPVGQSLDLVRFQPYSTDEDVRYITLGNASQAVDPNITFTAGETVIVTEDAVRMRAEASVDAKIVATLSRGTALEVTGDSMEPLYRDGDILIVSPNSAPRKGDRMVLRTTDGEVMAKILVRRTAKTVELASFNPAHPNLVFPLNRIDWMARIVWASQ